MKTFIDAGVLIAAYRGEPEIRRRALELLDDASREFVTSDSAISFGWRCTELYTTEGHQ